MAWTLLNTTDTFGRLIGLIRNASTSVTLISPYFDLGTDDRIGQEIRNALKRRVCVTVIVRSHSTSGARSPTTKQVEWQAAMKAHVEAGLVLYEVDWLHAKVYCSETEGIVSSLNLIRSSVTNSIEVGLHTTDAEQLKDLKNMIEDDVLRHKKAVSLKGLSSAESAASRQAPVARSAQPPPLPGREPPPLPGRAKADAEPLLARPVKKKSKPAPGYCLRCAEEMDFNFVRPYCLEHYRSWAKFENEDYEEKYCHHCGDEHASTMARPLCRDCFRSFR